jgi:hypothetical protein
MFGVGGVRLRASPTIVESRDALGIEDYRKKESV